MKKFLLIGFLFFASVLPASAATVSGGTSLSDPYCVSFDSEAEYDANVPTNMTLGFMAYDPLDYVLPFTPISTTVELHSGEPQLGPHCFPIEGLAQYNMVDWPNAPYFGMYEPGTQSSLNIWNMTDFMNSYIEAIQNYVAPTSTPLEQLPQTFVREVQNNFTPEAFSLILNIIAAMLVVNVCLAAFGVWLNRNR